MTDHLTDGVNESATATTDAPTTAAAVDPAAAAPETATATPGATTDAAATAGTGTGTSTSSVSTGTLSASGVTPAAVDANSDAAQGSVQAGGFTMLGDAGIACEGDACLI